MISFLVLTVTALLLSVPAVPGEPASIPTTDADDPQSLVDTFVGTARNHGNTFPGASMPFGMTQLTPLTPNATGGGYVYSDNTISGFALTHMSGSPCPNFGAETILPVVDRRASEPQFRHEDELAEPGYYRVLLSSGVTAEMTVTRRTGIFRFTYPTDKGYLRIPGKRLGPRTFGGTAPVPGICGSPGGFPVHFVYQVNAPVAQFGDLVQVRASVVLVKAALSYVSIVNAMKNLAAEDPDWSFDTIRARAESEWQKALDLVQASGGGLTNRRLLTTALYHVLLAPNTFSDANGAYIGADGKIHRAVGYVRYTNISGWDVYRTEFPLLCLLEPSVARDVVRSILGAQHESGWLGKWTMAGKEQGIMVGDPADAMIAEAVAFGVQVPLARALRAMVHGADVAQPGPYSYPSVNSTGYVERPGLADYLLFRYIPLDQRQGFIWGAASTSLEYMSDDFAIARVAAASGNSKLAHVMLTRSRSWRRLLNPHSRFLEPRNADGSFLPDAPIDEEWVPGYTEGTGRVYSWHVPHDLRDLIEEIGGDGVATGRLDRLFTRLTAGTGASFNGRYAEMANEPSFELPWIYLWTNKPERAQQVVRRIQRLFRLTPDGLPGDDDLGTTSAWYVWSALGLYPEIPGVDGLAVIDAAFPKIVINTRNPWTIRRRATASRWLSLRTRTGAQPPSYCRSPTTNSACD
jgi:putative alpha-1,2-mannosidase